MSASCTEQAWAAGRGLRRSTAVVCPCALTGQRCPRPDGYTEHRPLMRRLGADHASLWLGPDGPAVWVSQPYQLDTDALAALSAFAEQHGLELAISTEPAWHYPGKVLHVERTRADDAPAPVPSFAAWLSQHEGDQNARGDLARDVRADAEWPEDAQTLGALLAYLSDLGACDGALDACRAAWRDWCAQ